MPKQQHIAIQLLGSAQEIYMLPLLPQSLEYTLDIPVLEVVLANLGLPSFVNLHISSYKPTMNGY